MSQHTPAKQQDQVFREASDRRMNSLVDEVRLARENSEKSLANYYKNIAQNWGSTTRMKKKLAQVFGEPTEKDVVMAKKLMQERFGDRQPTYTKKRPFMVNNPI